MLHESLVAPISKTLGQRTEGDERSETEQPDSRIRNWPEYNAALIQRGSFTLWVDEAMLEQGYNTQKSGRRGASTRYSDLAIQCALTLKAV